MMKPQSPEDTIQLQKRTSVLINALGGEGLAAKEAVTITVIPLQMANDALLGLLAEIEEKAPMLSREKDIITEWLNAIRSHPSCPCEN